MKFTLVDNDTTLHGVHTDTFAFSPTDLINCSTCSFPNLNFSSHFLAKQGRTQGPLHSGPAGNSELCVQRAGRTSDHFLFSSLPFFLRRPVPRMEVEVGEWERFRERSREAVVQYSRFAVSGRDSFAHKDWSQVGGRYQLAQRSVSTR